MDASSTDETFDPTKRRLCADGACVGVIDADGRCTVCGRTEAEAAAGDEPAVLAPAGTVAPDAASGGDAVGFDPTRRLCDDGACVGVIGDDGVCRTCGRRAE